MGMLGVKILIVDDQSASRLMLRLQLETDGHDCIEAVNGLDAVELFEEHQPDCVLMDVMMPVMNGYLAAEKIKSMTAGRHIPVLFLTAVSDQEALVHCLDHGDDFLVKPVNAVLLKAKISAHGRTRELTREIREKNVELSQLHETLKQEHQLGEHVLSHAMRRNWKDCNNVRAFLSPMSIFNGDLFLVAPNPNGGLYAFLGDITGHGLSASIGAIPISHVFFTMCAKARPMKELVSELNATLKDFLPEDMFCAATLLQLNGKGDAIRVWTGGLPPAYVLREGEGIVQSLPSRHVPLGILGADVFSAGIDSYQLNRGDRLLLLSDGIHDVQNCVGEHFGETGVLRSLERGGDNGFESILGDIKRFSEGVEQKDDISLVELLLQPVQKPPREQIARYRAAPWKLGFHLGPEDLKDDEVLQSVIDMLPAGMAFADARFRLQVILTELYSNALEHGVLRLESDVKRNADGFADYYALRETRKQGLASGWIEIEIAYQPEIKDQELRVRVTDSGSGFNISEVEQKIRELSRPRACGRGLQVVKQLCHSFEVNEQDSSVYVTFPLSSFGVEE